MIAPLRFLHARHILAVKNCTRQCWAGTRSGLTGGSRPCRALQRRRVGSHRRSLTRLENRCWLPDRLTAELPTLLRVRGRATVSRRLVGRGRARTSANSAHRSVSCRSDGPWTSSLDHAAEAATPTDSRLRAEWRVTSRAPTPRDSSTHVMVSRPRRPRKQFQVAAARICR